ncbi:hypothetical protein GCM10018953_01820 [Streptosporangium nondiastaticum]
MKARGFGDVAAERQGEAPPQLRRQGAEQHASRVVVAVRAQRFAEALVVGSVADSVRRELRRQTSYNADPAEIQRILREEVLRSEALS